VIASVELIESWRRGPPKLMSKMPAVNGVAKLVLRALGAFTIRATTDDFSRLLSLSGGASYVSLPPGHSAVL
jgi:hypothetical protein